MTAKRKKGKPGKKARRLSPRDQDWITARKRFHLSHAHVQMAAELGMNPRKLGGLANHDQEPWKVPLPVFIERCYEKSFRRSRPEVVLSVEERARHREAKRARRKERRRRQRLGLPRADPPAATIEPVVLGQPKTASEYIQATSRAG